MILLNIVFLNIPLNRMSTYVSIQWAAVRMCLLLIIAPPSLFFNWFAVAITLYRACKVISVLKEFNQMQYRTVF